MKKLMENHELIKNVFSNQTDACESDINDEVANDDNDKSSQVLSAQYGLYWCNQILKKTLQHPLL